VLSSLRIRLQRIHCHLLYVLNRVIYNKGSVLIVEADSREEIIEALKKDIYYKSGVWDVDGAKITPMKLVFVRPL
jgi:hypothetical protein